MRAGPRLSAALPATLALAVCGALALLQDNLGDYADPRPGADNARPAIDALVAGDLGRATSVQPVMGSVSLLLRAPVAALTRDPVWRYRLGALVCLLAAAALAVAVDRRLARTGGMVDRVVTGALLLAGPATLAALDKGHPEEVLAGALAVGAVLAARERRAAPAAVLLGLAAGTKGWAIVAAPPVLIALPGARARVALVAAGVAALFVLPPILADPGRYHHAATVLSRGDRVAPQSLWWPFSSPAFVERRLPAGLTRGATSALTVVVAAALALTRRRADPLGLLAALLALRCALDPVNLEYYAAPAILALVTWDALARPGPPAVAVAATLGLVIAWRANPTAAPTVQLLLWLAATAPFALALRRVPAWHASSSSPTRSPA